jgi:hypothetical protein
MDVGAMCLPDADTHDRRGRAARSGIGGVRRQWMCVTQKSVSAGLRAACVHNTIRLVRAGAPAARARREWRSGALS